MSKLFRTKDIQLATLLRYEIGRDAHVAIAFDETGTGWFEFNRYPQCAAVARVLYTSTGYPIDDTRTLLREAAAVRKELATARDVQKRQS